MAFAVSASVHFNATTVLTTGEPFYVVDQKLQILDKPLDFSQAKNSGDWKNWHAHRPFIQSESFWLHARVMPTGNSKWIIKLNDATINNAQLYIVGENGVVESSTFAGSQLNADHDTKLDMTLPLTLTANHPSDIYVSINGHHQPFLQMEIWNEAQLAGYQTRQMFTFGAFLGGCLLIGAMLIAASLVTRHSTIYVQLLYSLLLLSVHLSGQGFMQKLLWPENQQWINQISLCLSGLTLAIGLSLLRVMTFAYMPTIISRAYYHVALMVIVLATLVTWLDSLVLQQLAYFVVIANMAIGLITLLALKGWRRMSFRFMMLGFAVGLLGHAHHSGWLSDSSVNSFDRSNALTISLMSHLLFIVCGSFIEVRHVLSNRLKEKLTEIEAAHQQRFKDHQTTQHRLYDPLTGCPNRNALQRGLQQKIEHDPNGQYGLILIYLGHFKEINNTLGHHNGDELLKRISHRLNAVVSQLPGVVNLEAQEAKVSHLAALEGVVFGVLMESIEQSLLISISEHIHQCLNQPFEYQAMSLDITGFLGIASYPEHGRNSSDILQHAHVAIEVAQERDQQVVYYSSELDPYSARRLTLVAELKHALRVGDLQLYYQPQVDLRLNEVIGVEALIRWRHRIHGFISPEEFIPVAEKTGVIRQLTAWVMDTAMYQAQLFYLKGLSLRVSINLSAKNLQEVDLPNEMLACLQKYGIPADMLGLEITETAMMMDPSRSMRNIVALNDCGIRLSIDDFGTGYSSLAYLKSLPVAEIKIDRSFVSDMCNDNDDQVIVKTTLNMSHNLGKEVVAEGIEDAETFHALLGLGCDIGQGYYIARPAPAEILMNWLKNTEYSVRKIHTVVPAFHVYSGHDAKRLS
jgi:diguanylate cyclase (GGDEF)-like protein